jgi:hypothetical protein
MNRGDAKARVALALIGSLLGLGTTACDYYWTPEPPIDANTAKIHAQSGSEHPVGLAGSRIWLSCDRPIDYDTKYPIKNGQVDWGDATLVQDQMSDDPNFWPKWHVSGGVIIGRDTGVTSITVQLPDAPGSATASFDDDDLPLDNGYADNDPNYGTRDDDPAYELGSTSIAVVVPQVVTVAWTTYPMYDKDPTKGDWDDSNVPLPNPQFGPGHAPAPVAIQKATKARTIQGCEIDQPITHNTDIVVKAEGTFETTECGARFEWGATTVSTGIHESVTAFPNAVGTLSAQLNWQYKVPDGSNTWIDMCTTDNPVYLTYGQPAGSCVTAKRVEWVCEKASGLSAEPNCVDGIFNRLNLSYTLGSTAPTPLWLLLAGPSYHADCGKLADFFMLCCQMLGLHAQLEKGFIYPKLAHAGGDWKPSEGSPVTRFVANSDPPHVGGATHPHGRFNWVEWIMFLDGQGGENFYEGAVRYGGRYYCIGEDIYTSPDAVMNAMVQKTFWCWQKSSAGPLDYDYCQDPGPYPEWPPP